MYQIEHKIDVFHPPTPRTQSNCTIIQTIKLNGKINNITISLQSQHSANYDQTRDDEEKGNKKKITEKKESHNSTPAIWHKL